MLTITFKISKNLKARLLGIFLFYIINIGYLFTQTTNLGITNRYEGEGNIGNNKISFILDCIERPYYIEGDQVGIIEQFSGKYNLENNENDILLYGTRTRLYQQEILTDSPLTLYVVDNKMNKTEIFKGILKKDYFKGVWKKINSKNTLKFGITFNENLFTELQVKTSKGQIILPINHRNKFNQNQYKILKIIERQEKTYVLIKLSLSSCSVLKARGSGCGGWDYFLRLYEIDKSRTKFSEVILEGGDQSYFYIFKEEKLTKKKYTAKVSYFEGEEEFSRWFTVDFSKIQDGIKQSKAMKQTN